MSGGPDDDAVTIACPTCRGRGTLEPDSLPRCDPPEPCPECKGTGRVEPPKKLD